VEDRNVLAYNLVVELCEHHLKAHVAYRKNPGTVIPASSGYCRLDESCLARWRSSLILDVLRCSS